jgi:hypothetical protein
MKRSPVLVTNTAHLCGVCAPRLSETPVDDLAQMNNRYNRRYGNMDPTFGLLLVFLLIMIILLVVAATQQSHSSSGPSGHSKSRVTTARDLERAKKNLAQLAGGIQAAQTAAANCKATLTIVQSSEPHLAEKQRRLFSQHRFVVRAQDAVRLELVRTRKTCQQALGLAGPFEPQFVDLLVRLFEAERACTDCNVRDGNGSECGALAVLSIIEVEERSKKPRQAGRQMEE